ncbi:MAG: glycosyltransferase family 4 protein [Vicinamibacteria bacterium]|nr:glycosyltransferase family 4 protein [Vicinamibacteria bacterium]
MGVRAAFHAWVYRQYRGHTWVNRAYASVVPYLVGTGIDRYFDGVVRRRLAIDGIGIDVRLQQGPSGTEAGVVRASPAPEPGVNLIGCLDAPTGAGQQCRQVARCLTEHGHPYGPITIELDRQWMPLQPKSLHNPYSVNLFYLNVELVPTLPRLLGKDFFRDRYNIGFWAWEQSRFPDDWLDRFGILDEIWVPTGFVQRLVAEKSPIPVVTMGVHVRCPDPPMRTREDLGWPSDRHVFLFVFDPTLEPGNIQRKNPDGLIEAYRAAFGPDFRDTLLVIKTHGLFRTPVAYRRLRAAVESVRGLLIDELVTQEHLDSIFHAADAYVSLHRGEGFGLPLAEMMMLGKPVIATGYSGNTDFMTPGNSWLVPYRLVEVGDTSFGPRQAGACWAQPDIEQAALIMRWVARNRQEAKSVGDKARADITRQYGSGPAYQRIRDRLSLIARWRSGR